MTSPRQTLSFLRNRFQEAGIRPDTRHGQNFLFDLNLIDLLAESAELTKQDVVLEVGTGTGSLTTRMAALAGQVVTVEIDPQLINLAGEAFFHFDNITLLHQDVLRNKNTIHPLVIETIQEKMQATPGARFKLAANLPYNIATPLISNLLALDLVPDLLAVTIQKELADRILARPSTKDYGALSIWVQSLGDPELVRVLPPDVFWPMPKIYSAFIRIRTSADKRRLIPDLDFFHQFVRALFFHRRKFLRSVLCSAFKTELTKPEVDQVLSGLDIDGNVRAEQLEVPEIQRIGEAFRVFLQQRGHSS